MAERGGKILAGMALEPTTTATSIRGDLLTDGPFIETKEGLGRHHVIEARDLDHALELAKLDPIVEGGVEVRPLLGFEVVELSAIEQAVAEAHRREWAYVLAATVRVTRDLDAAEDGVQDAYVAALTAWARDGVPERPGAWLTTAARRNGAQRDRPRGDARGQAAAAARARGDREPVRRRLRSPTTACGSSSPAATRRSRARRRSR